MVIIIRIQVCEPIVTMAVFPSNIIIVLLLMNTGLGALFFNLCPRFITLSATRESGCVCHMNFYAILYL